MSNARRNIILLFLLPLIVTASPVHAQDQESQESKDNPFFYHLSEGDAYLIQRIGTFLPRRSRFAMDEFFVQAPVLEYNDWKLITTSEFSAPFTLHKVPEYLYFHDKLRFRYDLGTVVKPFITAGYAYLEGSDRPLNSHGITAGFGSEFFLRPQWASPSLYVYAEGGTLWWHNDRVVRPYLNSRGVLSLGRFHIFSGENMPTLNTNMDGKFNFVLNSQKHLEIFAEAGPRLGLLFPNGHETALEWHWQYSRNYPFLNHPDTHSFYGGIQIQAPLDQPIASDSRLTEYPYSPTIGFSFTQGGGAHSLVMNEFGFNYMIPVFTGDKFLIQIDSNFVLSTYFRTGPNLSLFFFDVGPRFLLAHPGVDREASERPYWVLANYLFTHRSEHLINPNQSISLGNNPEAIVIQLTTPYWREEIWNENRSRWFDFVSFSFLMNHLIFQDYVEDPVRSNSGFSFRYGMALNAAKVGSGLLYLRGERARGINLMDWKAEGGWRHKRWALFVAGENLNVSPSTFSGISTKRRDIYGGVKLFFGMGN